MISHRFAFAVDPGHLYDIAADYSCESQRIGTHHIIYYYTMRNILSDALCLLMIFHTFLLYIAHLQCK